MCPYVITKIMAIAICELRRRGVRCLAYLDDLLFVDMTAGSPQSSCGR
jgi:hypothetical protein